jgi:hypothetical protein
MTAPPRWAAREVRDIGGSARIRRLPRRPANFRIAVTIRRLAELRRQQAAHAIPVDLLAEAAELVDVADWLERQL